MGQRPSRGEGGALRKRPGNALARVGGEELPGLRAGRRLAPARGRGRADRGGPAADRLPDGALRRHLPGTGLGGRFRGLLGKHTTLILLAWVLSLAWMIWLMVVASRPGGPRGARSDGGGQLEPRDWRGALCDRLRGREAREEHLQQAGP